MSEIVLGVAFVAVALVARPGWELAVEAVLAVRERAWELEAIGVGRAGRRRGVAGVAAPRDR